MRTNKIYCIYSVILFYASSMVGMEAVLPRPDITPVIIDLSPKILSCIEDIPTMFKFTASCKEIYTLRTTILCDQEKCVPLFTRAMRAIKTNEEYQKTMRIVGVGIRDLGPLPFLLTIASCHDDNRALSNAVKDHDTEKVKELLNNGANPNIFNVNESDIFPESLLRQACKQEDVGIAELLLAHGADVNYAHKGCTAFFAVMMIDDNKIRLKMLQLLIKYGLCIITETKYNREYFLRRVLKNGYLEEAQLLIALGIRTRAQWINEPDFLLTSPYLEATWELCVNNLCEEDQQKNGHVIL